MYFCYFRDFGYFVILEGFVFLSLKVYIKKKKKSKSVLNSFRCEKHF